MWAERVAALGVPWFAAAAQCRREPGLAGRPLVLGGPPCSTHVGESRPSLLAPQSPKARGSRGVWGVLAVSAEAAAAGVRVGMTLAQAESCCPDLVRRPYDAVHLAQEHERLLAALEAHVAVAPGALGWALFRPPWPSAEERRALAWLLDALAATTGYLAVVGVTEGRGAAEIVARAAVGTRLRAAAGRPSGSPPPWAGTAAPLGAPNAVAWVAPGGAATALAPLPAALLPVSAAMRRRLTLFGLPTIGALAALPLGAVQAQFGPEGRLAWLIAHGRDPRPLVPREPPGGPSAAVALDAPCTERARLLALAEVLLARALRAVPAGQGVSSIRLVAEIEPGPGAPATWEQRVVLREPTAAAEAIRFALAGALLRATPPGPIVGLRLELHDLGAPTPCQLGLFAPRATAGALAAAVRTLRARYGALPLRRVVALDPRHRLPERRYALVEAGPAWSP